MKKKKKSKVLDVTFKTSVVIGFVWVLWFRSLLIWLRQRRQPVLILVGVLLTEWLCWHFWGLRWLVVQILLLGLLAYIRRPAWLDERVADNPLAILVKLLKATKTVENTMTVKVNMNQAYSEDNNDYPAPLLTIPYSSPSLGRYEKPLTSAIALDNGILFAQKGQLVFDLAFLVNNDKQEFIRRMATANLNPNWPEVSAVINARERQKAAEQRIAVDKKITSIVKSDKSYSILKTLMAKEEVWNISIWNLNRKGIVESENALLVRVRLLGSSTMTDLRKQLPLIAKSTRVKVSAIELSDKGSANLIFRLRSQYSGHQLTVKEVEDSASNGRFELGMGDLGPIALKLPQIDFPATLIGGLSRSGKSSLTTMLVIALLSLKTASGKRTYDDIFVGTVKDEDYKALGWAKQGMYIAGQPLEVYQMLKQVDEICTKRKQRFIDTSVVNIKEYNEQHPANPLSNLLVIVDEYANLLSRAESETIEVDGKDIKLNKEIERLCIKIGQEHISRGCTIIVVTQNFAKNAVGKFYDVAGARIIGFAESNVASSLDNTGELAAAMRGQEQSRKGLFFLNSPDIVPTHDTLLSKMKNGFYQVRTNYVDTGDVAKNFDEHYETDNLYRRNTVKNIGKLPFI